MKGKLLLEVRRYVDKIDRNHLHATEDLCNELRNLEDVVARNRYENKEIWEKKEPCQIGINNKKDNFITIKKTVGSMK